MAFVGISQRLIGDVRDATRRMCSAELNTVGECSAITLDDDSNWYKELSFGEHIGLMHLLPQSWTRTLSGHGTFKVLDAEGEVYEIATRTNGHVRGLPPSHTDYRAFTATIDNPRLPSEIVNLVHRARERRAIEKRWNEVRNKVVQFLESCKSLNEALKLWPEVEHYIPKEYMEKVFAKREKSTTESRAMEVLGSLDTQELTAAAVIARLSGATV